MAWVGVGMGSPAGGKAGGLRTSLEDSAAAGSRQHGHRSGALTQGPGLSDFLSLLWGQLGGEEEAGGEESGHPVQSVLPSWCPLPLGTDCCLSPSLLHPLDGVQPRLCATVPVFQRVDSIAPCRQLASWKEHLPSPLAWFGPAWPSMLSSTPVQSDTHLPASPACFF